MLLIYFIYELDCCLFLVLLDFLELESCVILEDWILFFFDIYMEIKIRCFKIDVYRRGNIVYIVKINLNFCFV